MQRVAWTSGKCSPISAGRRPSRDAERGEQSEEPEERLKDRLKISANSFHGYYMHDIGISNNIYAIKLYY